MSQKSSLPQLAKSVSMALIPDRAPAAGQIDSTGRKTALASMPPTKPPRLS
jgi:hypothetical protein